jgi:hypothetical protein
MLFICKKEIVGFIFASYLDKVLVPNYTMGGFKKGKIAGTAMVPACCKSLKLPEIQAFA